MHRDGIAMCEAPRCLTWQCLPYRFGRLLPVKVLSVPWPETDEGPSRAQDLLTADEGLADGFRKVRFFVLDEADRLLEQSFETELRIIAGCLPGRRQTLLFSATLTRCATRTSSRRGHCRYTGPQQRLESVNLCF